MSWRSPPPGSTVGWQAVRSAHRPPFSSRHFVFWFNWLIIVFTAIFGFGMGGYASIKASLRALGGQRFSVAAACIAGFGRVGVPPPPLASTYCWFGLNACPGTTELTLHDLTLP